MKKNLIKATVLLLLLSSVGLSSQATSTTSCPSGDWHKCFSFITPDGTFHTMYKGTGEPVTTTNQQ